MTSSAMGSVAEFELRRTSERTKDALAPAKARGVKLGGVRPNTLKQNARAKAKAQQEATKLRGVLTPMIEANMPSEQLQRLWRELGKQRRTANH